MRKYIVFYAWQSDGPEKVNRAFIRRALDMAAARLSADGSLNVQVQIDADTEGVLGHVPVIDTILEKIERCDAIVPDLTFVAETEEGKLIPNPKRQPLPRHLTKPLPHRWRPKLQPHLCRNHSPA